MKKGFTLIEVLSVIVIISILVTICFTAVSSSIKKSKENAYKQQINNIEQAAQNYVLQESIEIDGTMFINISDLVLSGYIKDDNILNPLTNKEIVGCVKVTYNESEKSNNYLYVENCS